MDVTSDMQSLSCCLSSRLLEKSGVEVDVVSEEGGGLHLYEIKSGETIRPEAYDNINTLKRTLSNVTASTIIYDGETLGSALNIRDI